MQKQVIDDTPLRVLHIIGSLQKGGGAEEVLYNLVRENSGNTHIVLSLMDSGEDAERFKALGLEVIRLGMKKSVTDIVAFVRLTRLIRKLSPDVVQCWMYYSDVLGGLASRLAGFNNVIWGIHSSTACSESSARLLKIFFYLGARLSRFLPRRIVSVSDSGAAAHREAGYCASRMTVVYNGYDLSRFHGRESGNREGCPGVAVDATTSLRQQYAIGSGTICLGMVARFEPLKDHRNLLQALTIFDRSSRADWVCFFFGIGTTPENTRLLGWIEQAGLSDKCILFGLSKTVDEHIRQLDIHLMSSRSEAFPNALNEAMASEVPCISTNVGDAGTIIGDHGWLVPVSDPDSLAQSLEQAVDEMQSRPERWEQRRKACRQHIMDNFTLQMMCRNYETVWRS